jgi:ethanolamine utilization protein
VYKDSIDQSALIEIITKEVMKRIEEKINRSELVSSHRKHKILAIAMSEETSFNKKSDVYSVDYYENYDAHISIMPYDFIVLGHLSYQELAQISMGLAYDQVSSLVIECILANKKIFIMNEGADYHTYEETANTNFYTMLKGYEESKNLWHRMDMCK